MEITTTTFKLKVEWQSLTHMCCDFFIYTTRGCYLEHTVIDNELWQRCSVINMDGM